MVLPRLTYASEIFGYHIARESEHGYMKSLKHVMGVHRNDSNDIVYGE